MEACIDLERDLRTDPKLHRFSLDLYPEIQEQPGAGGAPEPAAEPKIEPAPWMEPLWNVMKEGLLAGDTLR